MVPLISGDLALILWMSSSPDVGLILCEKAVYLVWMSSVALHTNSDFFIFFKLMT